MAVYQLHDGDDEGVQIGASSTAKVGFFGATPVVRQTVVADATDAATAITQLNAVITRLENLGLFASS